MEYIKSPVFILVFSIVGCSLLLTQGIFLTSEKPETTSQVVNQQQAEIFQRDPELALHQTAMTEQGITVANIEQRPVIPFTLYPELDQIRKIEDEKLLPGSVISRLQPLSKSTDPVIRLAALRSIGEVNHSSSQSILLLALHDPEPLIRMAAIENLTLLENESVVIHIESLIFDADKEVRISAINALGDLESEQAVLTLASVLSDEDAEIRNSAVNALGEIDSDLAELYLIQQEHDANEMVRTNVMAILHE